MRILIELITCIFGLQVMFEFESKSGNQIHKEAPVPVITPLQKTIQFYGQVTAVINQAAPLPAALPPSVIGGIRAEDQQDRKGKTQKGVQKRNVL